MNNRAKHHHQTERHLKLWIYLLPIVGIVPSLWTLYRPQKSAPTPENREQQKVSRLSLTLVLVWLSSYALLSMGASHVSGIMSFRFLYANAILTSAYFIVCTAFMSRLGHKSLPPEESSTFTLE